MELIDGNKIAADIVAELKAAVAALPGRKPCIALVRVGEDPASVSYVKKKERTAAEIGITSRVLLPPAAISQTELFALIDQLNADPSVDGILVQSPPSVASPPPRMSTASAPSISARSRRMTTRVLYAARRPASWSCSLAAVLNSPAGTSS